MAKYNGHKNWNHWNVSLWINNDESLYRTAQNYAIECRRYAGGGLDAAAKAIVSYLVNECGTNRTPDGALYTVSAVRAAISDIR